MKRSRAVRPASFFATTLLLLGCAQIAGLSGDYRSAAAGAAGTTGGKGGTGGGAASGGTDSAGGDAGANGGLDSSGGDAGANGGIDSAGGSSSAAAGRGDGGRGGASGASDAAGSGGSSGRGDSMAGALNAGSGGSGVSGAAGSSSLGPQRIGYSEFHDSASGSEHASSHLADATFLKPADTAEGDFMLVFFGCDHELRNIDGTPGWTLLDVEAPYGTDGQGTYLLYKFAEADEPDELVFAGINDVSYGNGVQGLLSVYRGVNAFEPVNAYEVFEDPDGETYVTEAVTATPAITTHVDNCLLIAGLSPDTAIDAPVVTSWPDGFTENQVSVMNPAHPYPLGWANIYSAERHLAEAGTVPASEFAWAFKEVDRYYGSLTFVLALAP